MKTSSLHRAERKENSHADSDNRVERVSLAVKPKANVILGQREKADGQMIRNWARLQERWNMRKLCPFAVALLVAVTACRRERTNRTDIKYSDKSEQTAKKLRQEIRAEIATLTGHEWAGTYYEGDGLGVNISLDIAPKSGYLFEWHGCLGLYDRNCGAVTASNGRLRLSFTFANKREGFQGIAEEFVPIPWGDRKYLVPSDQVAGFCNHVNAGLEPRNDLHGCGLIRLGDERKKVTGFPSVPREFTAYLLSKPVEAEIIAVRACKIRPTCGTQQLKETLVVLGAGKVDGLLPGMELYVSKPDNIGETVEIAGIDENKSEGVMIQIGEDEPGPQIGWKLSTRPPWRQDERTSSRPATSQGNR